MGAVAIRQEDPPDERQGCVKWSEVLHHVAAGRGKWFRVAEYKAANTAQNSAFFVRKRHDPDGRFEIVTRKCVVYARLKTGAKS